jgi:hypothetical protein
MPQGPYCKLDAATCPGDKPPLFDYYDGVNPCLCVDTTTIADRDLVFGLFWIALGLSGVLMLHCIVAPCMLAISSDSVGKIIKVRTHTRASSAFDHCSAAARVLTMPRCGSLPPRVRFSRRSSLSLLGSCMRH